MENIEQRLVEDKSGWIVVGGFDSEGNMLLWFNAEEDDWFLASTFLPEGAEKGEFQNGQWVALDSQGEISWKFNQESDKWEEVEPLPTRYDDPELQARMVEEFLEKTGFSSIEQALEIFENNSLYLEYPGQGFGGLDGDSGPRNYWGTVSTYMNVGISRISINHIPGAESGDFAQILYGGRPGLDTLMPFIVGIQWKGQWVTAPKDTTIYDELGAGYDVDGLNSPEDLENWVEENIGEAFAANIYLYFENPGDWAGVHFDKESFPGIEGSNAKIQVKQMMDASQNGYIQRVTRDPEILGGGVEILPWSGLEGRLVGIGQIYDVLDPSIDPGLYISLFGNLWEPPR